MNLGDVESSLKVLVIGSDGVGKSSLLHSYCRNEFIVQYRKTIGTEFKEKNIELPDVFEEVNMMIWEIGGEHTLKANNVRHFKDANAVIIMFSTVDRKSFDRVLDLHAKVKEECGDRALTILVQNKIDLIDDTIVTRHQVEALARKIRVRLYRCSCKDLAMVEEIFLFLASKLNGTAAVALTSIGDVIPEIAEEHDTNVRDEVNGGPVEGPATEVASDDDSARNCTKAAQKHLSTASKELQSQSGIKGAQSVTQPSKAKPLVVPDQRAQLEVVPTMPSKQRTKGNRGMLACLPFL